MSATSKPVTVAAARLRRRPERYSETIWSLKNQA